MEEIKGTQSEMFNSVNKKFVLFRTLSRMLSNYDVETEKVINDLAVMQNVDNEKYKNVQLGLVGLNTKNKSITLGFKYLSDDICKLLEEIIADIKMLEEQTPLNVLVGNVSNTLSGLMMQNVLAGNINGMNDSLAAKEFARNTFKIILEKEYHPGYDITNFVKDISNTITNKVYHYEPSFKYDDDVLHNFSNTLMTHIDNNKGNDIYVTTETVPRDCDTTLPENSKLQEDITAYIVKKEYAESEITTADILDVVIEISNKLFTIDEVIQANIDKLPRIDYIVLTNILVSIIKVVKEYGKENITKGFYNKQVKEYTNAYLTMNNELVKYTRSVLVEAVDMNRDIKLVYICKTMFEHLLIEGSISFRG